MAPDQEANKDIFLIVYNMKVGCVFSLESPQFLRIASLRQF